MAWIKEKTKRVNLDSIGYEGLWVDLKPMNSLSYKQTKDLQKRVQSLLKVTGENAENASDEEVEEGLTSLKVVFSELVKDWNFPAVDGEIGDGSKLTLPSKNPDIIEEIPLEILGLLGNLIQGDEDSGVPNGSGT